MDSEPLTNNENGQDARYQRNGGSAASEAVVTNYDVSPTGDITPESVMGSKKALWAWLILCFSTGPVSGMATTYVSAAILSAANAVGHVPGSHKACPTRGTNLRCNVKFGTGEIDYASYTLYLKAIARAMEGVVAIVTSGVADFSDYRKVMLITSIILFGAFALPFAGLTKKDYSHLTALSVLYIAITTAGGMYTIIEASYIPIFMRAAGWSRFRHQIAEAPQAPADSPNRDISWQKGFTVSVLGLVSSNVGALIALLIGVIIVYGRGSYVEIGYFNYLLAITIAGCITIVFAVLGWFLLPSVPGKERPKDQSLLLLPFRRWFLTLKSITRYPEAFKLVIGWIFWYNAYSNYLSLVSALFLQVSGIGRSSGVYTVWTFTNVIFACIGSLGFMFTFPHVKVPIKTWAYIFLFVNGFCIFWGCLGISDHVPIGFKHTAEFWVQQVLFMATSSALRSYNRTLYGTLLPKGSEAQFFGLEITLDLATGWINSLVQGVIQDRTHNLRFPMIPNLVLIVIATGLYCWVDVKKGIEDAKKPLDAQ